MVAGCPEILHSPAVERFDEATPTHPNVCFRPRLCENPSFRAAAAGNGIQSTRQGNCPSLYGITVIADRVETTSEITS